jgi:L-arabinokinase
LVFSFPVEHHKASVHLDPIPNLLQRTRAELAADFSDVKSIVVARAPGRLDVMGGIADYTGSLVCEMPLDRAAGVALQARDDRQVQVFSFNLLDDHRPFTLRIPLEALANQETAALRKEFAEPGRQWAGYLAGCLHILHKAQLIDLNRNAVRGLNLALLSTVSVGAGISSSAAIEVATMIALLKHFSIPYGQEADGSLAPIRIASLCQQVENEIVGAPCGIMDQATSVFGRAGTLMRMVCQPHELLDPLPIPAKMRFIGIDSGVRHSVGGGQYGRTRCAAFMAHRVILQMMRQIGAAAGRELITDPMNGYLANLDPEDYKRIFRPRLPDRMKGGEFLLKYGSTIDTVTKIEPDTVYEIVHAADHHVLEARRVKNFAQFVGDAAAMGEQSIGSRDRGLLLDKAGHLMYASNQSYTMDAMLGSEECDLLVTLLRSRERSGIYGARITGGGSGGTVAVLCEIGAATDAAIAEVMADYTKRTGRTPTLFAGTSDGALWTPATNASFA